MIYIEEELLVSQEEDILIYSSCRKISFAEEDLLLSEEEDILLAEEEDLLLVQEEDLHLVQEEDLLLVQYMKHKNKNIFLVQYM